MFPNVRRRYATSPRVSFFSAARFFFACLFFGSSANSSSIDLRCIHATSFLHRDLRIDFFLPVARRPSSLFDRCFTFCPFFFSLDRAIWQGSRSLPENSPPLPPRRRPLPESSFPDSYASKFFFLFLVCSVKYSPLALVSFDTGPS